MDVQKITRVKKEVRRAQMLEAAKILFAENGYENTTAKDIAKAIGVSETRVFQIFGSKEAIYNELFLQWAEDEKKVIKYDVFDGSAIKTLYAIADDLINNNGRMVYEASGRDILLSEAIHKRHGFEQEWNKVLSEGSDIVVDSIMPIVIYGQISGEIREGSPRELASSYFAWVMGARSRKRNFPGIYFNPSIDIALDMLRKR